MKNLTKKDAKRTWVIIILTLFLVLFTLVNSQLFFKASIIYIIFLVIGLLLLKKGAPFIGIDKTINRDILYGVLFGLVFIGLAQTGLSIGTPDLPQSIEGTNKFLITGVAAPVGEEVLFRGMLLPFLISLKFIAPIVAILFQAGAFALFHLTAYGSVGLMSGAFIGAIVFAISAGVITIRTKSVLPVIIGHSVLNTYLVIALSVGFA